jgi:hypothetical protein
MSMSKRRVVTGDGKFSIDSEMLTCFDHEGMDYGRLLIRKADHHNPSWLSQSFGFHHVLFVGE